MTRGVYRSGLPPGLEEEVVIVRGSICRTLCFFYELRVTPGGWLQKEDEGEEVAWERYCMGM